MAGHCGCPPPRKPWVEWFNNDRKPLLPLSQKAKLEENELPTEDYVFVENPSRVGQGFITSYHIDTELGLRIFADTLKRHQLV